MHNITATIHNHTKLIYNKILKNRNITIKTRIKIINICNISHKGSLVENMQTF